VARLPGADVSGHDREAVGVNELLTLGTIIEIVVVAVLPDGSD
jgi:hypothetical protein